MSKAWRRLGVSVSIRRVEAAEYQRRRQDVRFRRDRDSLRLRSTPGVELRNFWSSEAAKTDGSRNLAGISHPAIDALIDKAMEAKGRQELETAMRALDRVVRAGHYWVSKWYKPVHHVAHWNKYSRPAKRPRYDRGIASTPGGSIPPRPPS